MVSAEKDGRVEYIGSVAAAKEFVEEGGYTFFDEDTGKILNDPVPAVAEYSSENCGADIQQSGITEEDVIKILKANGINVNQ